MAKKCLWVPQNWFFFKKIFLAKIFLENLSKWTKNTHPEVFSGVKFNSKTFLFSSLWPKNASKCLKIDFFGKLVNLGQTLTCRDSMGLQLIGLRDPSHLIIYQYVPHMSYAAIRKFLRGYHNHRMCNSAWLINEVNILPVDTPHRELETSATWSGLCFNLGFSSFASSRHRSLIVIDFWSDL